MAVGSGGPGSVVVSAGGVDVARHDVCVTQAS